ncbi:predicted protein [Botrytis cinerea T4]|uniref:Uncharacterized protein n=1 Tax=Botryotinia fuckeliana (strain T4) TaxID=999810 RepID=G2XTR3_BOTF4|nr:predicted protein [Botrytis cinerea T4]
MTKNNKAMRTNREVSVYISEAVGKNSVIGNFMVLSRTISKHKKIPADSHPWARGSKRAWGLSIRAEIEHEVYKRYVLSQLFLFQII